MSSLSIFSISFLQVKLFRRVDYMWKQLKILLWGAFISHIFLLYTFFYGTCTPILDVIIRYESVLNCTRASEIDTVLLSNKEKTYTCTHYSKNKQTLKQYHLKQSFSHGSLRHRFFNNVMASLFQEFVFSFDSRLSYSRAWTRYCKFKIRV